MSVYCLLKHVAACACSPQGLTCIKNLTGVKNPWKVCAGSSQSNTDVGVQLFKVTGYWLEEFVIVNALLFFILVLFIHEDPKKALIHSCYKHICYMLHIKKRLGSSTFTQTKIGEEVE